MATLCPANREVDVDLLWRNPKVDRSYKEDLTKMLFAGLEWLDAHPGADLHVIVDRTMVTPDTQEALQFLSAILRPSPPAVYDLRVVITRCLWIRDNGWTAFIEKLEENAETAHERTL